MYHIFSITISTSVIILLLILIRPILYKFYKAKLIYCIWLFIAVRLLIPLNPVMPYSLIQIPAIPDIGIYNTLEPTTAPIRTELSHTDENSKPAPEGETTAPVLYDIVFIIWGTGAIAFLMYHIICYILFKKKVRVWNNVVENKKPQIAICKIISSPMLFGVRKPIILLPDLDYSQADLEMIITHETVHYKRKDIWYKFILLLANAVHWFNPIINLSNGTLCE